MKIALLGYGKEGHAAEDYFKRHFNASCDIFENFTAEEIKQRDYSSYDIIFRSPSVPPLNLENESSVTKYFFDHCPCKIIGVTGTKGKGTTCSLASRILEALGKKVYLVGNIGLPSLNVLDDLTPEDVVVYEMSSFQLWDLKKSPAVAVVLRIEADHLNVHNGYADYVNAKSHIAAYQSPADSIIYFKNNPDSRKIAKKSPAKNRFAYPEDKKSPEFLEVLGSLGVPGDHNKENAEAALLAVAAFLNVSLPNLINREKAAISGALKSFKGLPHHIEFVRSLNGIDYYDDSFSASFPSLEVALKSFPNRPVVLIAGGKDRGLDLTPIKHAIFDAPNLKKAVLIGETRFKLSASEDSGKFILKSDFKDAIETARSLAEALAKNPESPNSAHLDASSANSPVVLLSPGAASFDMFKDFYDRGEQFKKIVKDF